MKAFASPRVHRNSNPAGTLASRSPGFCSSALCCSLICTFCPAEWADRRHHGDHGDAEKLPDVGEQLVPRSAQIHGRRSERPQRMPAPRTQCRLTTGRSGWDNSSHGRASGLIDRLGSEGSLFAAAISGAGWDASAVPTGSGSSCTGAKGSLERAVVLCQGPRPAPHRATPAALAPVVTRS
jgi:hypothetical protein